MQHIRFIGTVDFAKGPRPGDKGLVFGHEGSNGLWYSKVLAAPELDLAVLVACNRGGDAIGGKAVPQATLAMEPLSSLMPPSVAALSSTWPLRGARFARLANSERRTG